jgi:hypothetical protein
MRDFGELNSIDSAMLGERNCTFVPDAGLHADAEMRS